MIERVKSAMVGLGAGWVLVLMLVLSVVSLAIMLERAWLYWSLRDDVPTLMRDLGRLLRGGDLDGARKRLEASPSAEAAVVIAGIVEAGMGAEAAEEAMLGASALQKLKLEKRLTFLGTLGNNAPFIGLLGTVIGIVGAFDELGKQKNATMTAAATQVAPEAVMTNISEALVATAVGLLVAIPAVAAFNWFQRIVRATLANTEALSHVLLAHLKATGTAGADVEAAIETAAARGDRASKASKSRSPRRTRTTTDGWRRSRRPERRDHGDQRHPAGRHHARSPHHLHGDGEAHRLEVGAARSAEGGVGLGHPDGLQHRARRRRHHADRLARRPNDDAILAQAKAAREKNPELRAIIKADSSVPHGRVIHVLDLLEAGAGREDRLRCLARSTRACRAPRRRPPRRLPPK